MYKIEIACYIPGDERAQTPAHGNHNVHCPPLNETLRGRYRNSDSPIPVSPDLASMPDIPGIQITVDEDERTVLVHDPLQESRDLDRIKKVLEKNGAKGNRPDDDRQYHNVSDEKLDEWHSFARYCVKNNYAFLLGGELPPEPAEPKRKPRPILTEADEDREEDEVEA